MSQVCVITGGTSGIGRCTAQAMLARGYTVYELSRRAEGVAGMQHIVADVTKEETLAAAVAQNAAAPVSDAGRTVRSPEKPPIKKPESDRTSAPAAAPPMSETRNIAHAASAASA